MDKDIETMTKQGLERAADELLAADAMKPAPKKKSTRRTKAAEEEPAEEGPAEAPAEEVPAEEPAAEVTVNANEPVAEEADFAE